DLPAAPAEPSAGGGARADRRRIVDLRGAVGGRRAVDRPAAGLVAGQRRGAAHTAGGLHRAGGVRRRRAVAPAQARPAGYLVVPAAAVAPGGALSAIGGLAGRAGADHPLGLLDDAPQRRTGAAMSRFRNEVSHLQAHVRTLRLALGALFLLALLLGFGWWSAPSQLTIHVPPDLRSGSARKWWDVPPESVYAFTFYVWQQLQRWPSNGEEDYLRNLQALSAYFTPACQAFLRQD